MKDIQDVIKRVYEKVSPLMCQNLNEEEVSIVRGEYMGILQHRYANLQVDPSRLEDIYTRIAKLEYDEWVSISPDMIRHLLFQDKALNRIIDITNGAFKKAQVRLQQNITISAEEADKLIEQAESLLEQVADYNKELAKWHLSEGIMDLKYASGQTALTSLRIGHYK